MIIRAKMEDAKILAGLAIRMWEDHALAEFAGDCELINEDSLKFHMALGFEEANRIICFRKDI